MSVGRVVSRGVGLGTTHLVHRLQPPYKSAVEKRVRDSEFGQPRSDTVSPNHLNLEEGIAYMPAFTDVTETKLKELEIRPILTLTLSIHL